MIKIKLDKKLKLILKFAVSLSLLALVFSRVDFHAVIASIKQVDFPFFFMAVLIMFLSQVVYCLTWSFILRKQDRQIKISQLLIIHFSGIFLDMFVPGGVAGEAYRGYSSGKNFSSFASVFLLRFAAILVLGFIAVFAFCFSSNLALDNFLFSILFAFLIILILAIFAFERILMFFAKKGKLGIKKEELENLKKTLLNPQNIIQVVILLVFYQLLTALVYFFLAASFDLNCYWLDLLKLIPIAIFICSVPISLGGLGVRELTYVSLFGRLGWSGGQSLSLALGMYSARFLIAILGITLYYIFRGRKL